MKAAKLAEFLLKHPDAEVDVSVDMNDDKDLPHGATGFPDEPRVYAEVFDFQESQGTISLLTRFESKNYKGPA